MMNVYEEENCIYNCVVPGESLTASSWPFFLVQMYFPLLALSATLRLIHSNENMVLADLKLEGTLKRKRAVFLNKYLNSNNK